ncbi:alpha-internexin-like protein [Lates japonicus]|uniref:Alpha-internexin-like protein n=1 Tax=Lates japonicus TaxID=270547 RepID=A0AAD3RAC9_LATJO|nr:alpha-internexin-like protein [Lates japonicus]
MSYGSDLLLVLPEDFRRFSLYFLSIMDGDQCVLQEVTGPPLSQFNSISSWARTARKENTKRVPREAEATLRLSEDVDDATAWCLDLEKKVESLLDEINFLRKVHEEVVELTGRQSRALVSVEMEVSEAGSSASKRFLASTGHGVQEPAVHRVVQDPSCGPVEPGQPDNEAIRASEGERVQEAAAVKTIG